MVSNPRRVALGGLPDLAAVAVAKASGEDLRNGTAAGAPVRLLTQPILDTSGTTTGFLQTVFVLSLHRSQVDEVWQTVLLVSLIGLIGATLVTLLVTHRALPRSAPRSPPSGGSLPRRRTNCAPPWPSSARRRRSSQREDLVQPEGRRVGGRDLRE